MMLLLMLDAQRLTHLLQLLIDSNKRRVQGSIMAACTAEQHDPEFGRKCTTERNRVFEKHEPEPKLNPRRKT